MDKPKIKWSYTILIDTVLVNLAFLFAYLTSKQFGFDLLNQPLPFFTLLQSADVTPYQYFFGIAAVVTIIRLGLLLGFNLYKTDVATRVCQGIPHINNCNYTRDCSAHWVFHTNKNCLGPLLNRRAL